MRDLQQTGLIFKGEKEQDRKNLKKRSNGNFAVSPTENLIIKKKKKKIFDIRSKHVLNAILKKTKMFKPRSKTRKAGQMIQNCIAIYISYMTIIIRNVIRLALNHNI